MSIFSRRNMLQLLGGATGVAIGKTLSDAVLDRGGWVPVIRESFAGAWQQNVEINFNSVLSNHAVFACISLISSDIAKLRVMLTAETTSGIWEEVTNPAYSPVLRKPNGYQTRIQFWESWILSKLTRGNTYALKQRDGRGIVTRLYVLDPNRVRPLLAEDGSVFYELKTDDLSGLHQEMVIVPAREIIHDRFNCFFHPLVGTSPIFAAGLSAQQSLNIQSTSTTFFGNGSQPGGILTAPARISDETVARLKEKWETNFSGTNRGKVAILGDGLKYERMAMSAEESQLIEQFKWSAEVICSCFHVPPYKIGVGTMPAYNNIQSLNVEYYSQCLQRLIEDVEVCLDEALEVGEKLGVAFNLDGLLRMDSVTQMNVLKEGIGASVLAPNEARKKIDLPPVEGGDSPMAQQQDFSLAALAKRDAKDDPFGTKPVPSPSPPPANDNETEQQLQSTRAMAAIYKGLR